MTVGRGLRAGILTLLLAAPAVPETPGDGVIWGVVRNAWSRAGLRRAIVVLSTTGANPMDAVAYSDSNGAFAFTGVPAGKYFLCARYKGYEGGCYGGSTDSGRPAPHLFLGAGERKTGLVLAMLPLGSVSGTVLDGDGDPVNNAAVSLLRPSYSRRKLEWQIAGRANTDDRGEYQLPFLMPGQYRVMAARPYGPVTAVRPEVTNGEKPPELVYAPQFYPNSDNATAADTIALNAGNDLKGIDFSLPATEQLTVGGTVEPPRDVTVKTPMAENTPVSLFLVPQSGGYTGEPFGAGLWPPDYHFQFSVPAGSYLLVATAQIEGRSFRSTQKIEVTASTDDLAVTLVPGTPLAGKLKIEGAQKTGPYEIHLYAGDNLPGLDQRPTAAVREDGTFQFDSVVPGLWDIDVEPQPAGSYIKSMTLGDKDVLTDDMFLQAGTRPALNIALSTNGAVVSGKVFEEPGRPAGRVMVLLAPEGKFDNVLSFYQRATAEDNGQFEFKSVTPGRYKVYAFDRMQDDEYWNPEFLKPYTEIGEAFDAAEGARVKHDATLIVRGAGGAR